MKYANELSRLGFRKWYERRLAAAHGFLLLCIVALVMVTAMAELISMRTPTRELVLDVALLMASGAIAIFGWLKYRMHMMLAAELSEYATCMKCKHYGALKFPSLTAEHVELECKKCSARWRVDTQMFRSG